MIAVIPAILLFLVAGIGAIARGIVIPSIPWRQRALGIIGEYLGRMHFRLLDRPSYVVRATGGFGEVSSISHTEDSQNGRSR